MTAPRRPAVSVVVPVHDNQATLGELAARISAGLSGEPSHEIVFVDDASPDGSREVARELAARDPRIRLVALERNRGQHEAALAGLRYAQGDWLVVLDADLQDPPEAIPWLLARGREGYEAVFAGRRGTYEGAWRTLTGRAYRSVLSRLLPVPRDAGMFFALERAAADRLLAMPVRTPQLVAMIGAARLRCASLPVPRRPRPGGHTAYTARARARSAAAALGWALGPQALLAVSHSVSSDRRERHNRAQRRYFEDRAKPNMVARPSRYVERQVDELIDFAGLRAGDRVLEIGCGLGRYTLPLAERGLRVTGIDIAPALLERLHSGLSAAHEVELIAGDIVSPPASLGRDFDAVVGFFVVHHLHDIGACMRSIRELVRTGGSVAFLEPNAYNPLYYVQIAATPSMSWEGDRGVVQMRRAPLLAALERAGFSGPRLNRFGFLPPAIVNRPRGPALERRLERLRLLRPLLAFQVFGARRA